MYRQQHCVAGDWIVDAMCGSGACSVAAATLGMNTVAFDISNQEVSIHDYHCDISTRDVVT